MLSFNNLNARQFKFVLFVPKPSGGTVTYSPCVTLKMAAITIVLQSGKKEILFPLLNSLELSHLFHFSYRRPIGIIHQVSGAVY